MERNYTVYVHQNQLNNKRYVGITADTVESRWRNGAGYKTQVFGRAIQKYGWENFKHYIIAENLTQEEAQELEISLIKEFHTQDPDFGYNIAAGGNATLPNLYKEVYQYNNKGELVNVYPSQKAAEKATGIRGDSIGSVCNGKRYTAGNFTWSYKSLTQEEVLSLFKTSALEREKAQTKGLSNALKKISMKVQQIDPKTGRIVAEFSSQREAARAVNIDQKGISNTIRGKQKTAGGYIWKTI